MIQTFCLFVWFKHSFWYLGFQFLEWGIFSGSCLRRQIKKSMALYTKNSLKRLRGKKNTFKTSDNNKSQRSPEGTLCTQNDSICASCHETCRLFLRSRSSFSCSHEPANSLDPKPDKSNSYPQLKLHKLHLNVTVPSKPMFLTWSLSFRFVTTLLLAFLFSAMRQCVLHAPTNSLSSIWSSW